MKTYLKVLFLCIILAATMLIPTISFAAKDSVEFNMYTDVYDVIYDGKVAIEIQFERPVLAGESPAIAKINEDLIAKSKQFYAKTIEDETPSYAADAVASGQTYHDCISARVSKNEKGLLCVMFDRHWYMGGVGDGGTYGATYNIYTGEELKIPDLFNMEVAETEKYIKDTAVAFVSQEGFFPESAEMVRNRDLKDFNFYIEGNTLYLCFAKYEVIYGGAGPQIIEYEIINPKEFSPIKVFINDKEIEFDVNPVSINNRTMVPMRAIFEELGSTVEWDGETKTVTSVKGKTVISLTLGVPSIIIDDVEKELDVSPIAIDGRTLVPVRAVSEAFALNVEWDGEANAVLIKGE